MLKEFILQLLRTTCVYRVVIASHKPDDNTGGEIQKRWLTIGSMDLFFRFESLHNPERRLANKRAKLWSQLKKVNVQYNDAVRDRRSRVSGVGLDTNVLTTKGMPYQDSGVWFEVRRFNVQVPCEKTSKEVEAALGKFGGTGSMNVTGTNISKKDALKLLQEKGKTETAAIGLKSGHTNIEGEVENVRPYKVDDFIKKTTPQNNNGKGKGSNQQNHNGKGGYKEHD